MLNSKQLDKVQKKLGKNTMDELDKLSELDLKKRVVEANQAMKQAEEELEANEKYQEIKRDKSYLETGKREVNARQKAVINYALHLLEEKGKVPETPLQKLDRLTKETADVLDDALKARSNG